MGKHYVPQRHLRRFSVDGRPDLIWQYDKVTRQFKDLPIAKVAQAASYYDDDVELAITKEVEVPGGDAIDKLLRKGWLTDRERMEMSLYLMIMTSRGPRARRKSFERVSAIRQEVVEDVIGKIQEWANDKPLEDPLVQRRLKEVDEIKTKYVDNQEIPEQIIKQLRTPFWSERTVAAIYGMKWHILKPTNGDLFVTSDSPVHYFEGLGLGRQNSELTYPISKHVALIGNHRSPKGIVNTKCRPQFVKEVNRRVLSQVERCAFSSIRAEWIDDVTQKAHPYLSEIRM
ncbi:MAG: DUF4238 domain-containing protein [Gemmatales bacterium]